MSDTNHIKSMREPTANSNGTIRVALDVIRDVGIVLAVICSGVALLKITWLGGALQEKVMAHEKIIASMQASGTSPLSAHIESNRQWQLAVERRIEKVEEAIAEIVKAYSQLGKDVAVIANNLEWFRSRAIQDESKKPLTGSKQ